MLNIVKILWTMRVKHQELKPTFYYCEFLCIIFTMNPADFKYLNFIRFFKGNIFTTFER